MEYKISGTIVPSVELTLNRGERVYTQSGGMFWQTEGISMNTNTRGGFLKGLGRMFAGESMFMANYTAEKHGAKIAFVSTVPGSLIPINVSGAPFTIQKGAFLVAEDSVELKTAFKKKLGRGLFGGEGFILQELQGSGMAFLEVDGDAIEMTLGAGEVIKVDTGNVVGFESNVSYEITEIPGFTNAVFGGEGVFLTKLTGPGKVILQTMNINEFAQKMYRYMPITND